MSAARQARPCSRCGETKPPEDYVPRGRTCAACRAAGPPSLHRNLPRHCFRCHELKQPDDFAWGDGSKAAGPTPAYRRRRNVCRACVAIEEQAKAAHQTQRRATWTTSTGKTVRRCPRCKGTKPLDGRNFYVARRDPLRYDSYCKPCRIARNIALTRRKLADPENGRAEHDRRNRWAREWRARNPERTKAYERRYREQLKADPERYAKRLEADRLSWRLRRERAGADLSTVRALRPSITPREMTDTYLPVAPLVECVQHFADDNIEAFCTAVGIESRSWRRWCSGESARIQLLHADRALTALGLNPQDVWDDPQVVACFYSDSPPVEVVAA